MFGTFDILHPGHENFFRQARKLGKKPYLIVSVARDVNVKKIKGRLPRNAENRRLSTLKKHALVDKAVLGNKTGYFSHIMREKPSIIALGYDQKVYVTDLKKKLKQSGSKIKVYKLKAFKPTKYKSSLF